MKNDFYFEWVIEEYNEHGDINDPQFFDVLDDYFYRVYFDSDETRKIALIRMIGNNEDGEIERDYAYVKDGVLPASFPDGHIVPKKYRREILDFFNRLEY